MIVPPVPLNTCSNVHRAPPQMVRRGHDQHRLEASFLSDLARHNSLFVRRNGFSTINQHPIPTGSGSRNQATRPSSSTTGAATTRIRFRRSPSLAALSLTSCPSCVSQYTPYASFRTSIRLLFSVVPLPHESWHQPRNDTSTLEENERLGPLCRQENQVGTHIEK